jgi:hypothetical protein
LKVRPIAAFYGVLQAKTDVAAPTRIKAQMPSIMLFKDNLFYVKATQLCAQIKFFKLPSWKLAVFFSQTNNLQGRLTTLQAGANYLLIQLIKTNLTRAHESCYGGS